MNQEDFNEILKKHHKWLNDESGGERANLRGANLRSANLSGANLIDANLIDANLINAKNVPHIPIACPEKGSFTAFKKAYRKDFEGCLEDVVIELEVPENAKRSSATSRKCRASKTIPKAIYRKNRHDEWVMSVEKRAVGWQDNNFIYTVGEEALPDSFDDDRWKECSNGIHFFMTMNEAIEW